MQLEDTEFDFSSAWHFSDAILEVEEEKFHVHRGVLSMWSSVLEKELKKKNQITLQCRHPDHVRELLLVVYPTRKPVTQGNVHFLLPLGHDYKMGLLVSLCEEVLLEGFESVPCAEDALRKQDENDIIDRTLPLLLLAIKYNMKPLRKRCIANLMAVKLKRLRKKTLFKELDTEDRVEIAEGRVDYYERRETCYRA